MILHKDNGSILYPFLGHMLSDSIQSASVTVFRFSSVFIVAA